MPTLNSKKNAVNHGITMDDRRMTNRRTRWKGSLADNSEYYIGIGRSIQPDKSPA